MTPRLWTWGEKGTGNPSTMMGGAGVCCDLVMLDLGPMSRASVLLLYSCVGGFRMFYYCLACHVFKCFSFLSYVRSHDTASCQCLAGLADVG